MKIHGPLSQKPTAKAIGEPRSLAVHRFLSLEHSLRYKGHFQLVGEVIHEYMNLAHAEVVPTQDLNMEVQILLPSYSRHLQAA